MSVIVKGMAMPSECEYCGFCRYYPSNGNVWCNATNKLLKMNWENPDWTHLDVKRPDWCPLVELPEHHGDLIDRQKLLEDNKHLEYPTDGKYRRDRAWSVGFNAGAKHCNEHAVYAKTVFEAEGAEE